MRVIVKKEPLAILKALKLKLLILEYMWLPYRITEDPDGHFSGEGIVVHKL